MAIFHNAKTQKIVAVILNIILLIVMILPGSATDGTGKMGNYAQKPESYLNETLDMAFLPQFTFLLACCNQIFVILSLFVERYFPKISLVLTICIFIATLRIFCMGGYLLLASTPPIVAALQIQVMKKNK